MEKHQTRRPDTGEDPRSAFPRIFEIARQIPHGSVPTYGQIAEVMGPPVTAREVGDAMAALRAGQPDPPVPWQRVINAQGRVSTGQRQQLLLEQEGVVFNVKGVTTLGALVGRDLIQSGRKRMVSIFSKKRAKKRNSLIYSDGFKGAEA